MTNRYSQEILQTVDLSKISNPALRKKLSKILTENQESYKAITSAEKRSALEELARFFVDTCGPSYAAYELSVRMQQANHNLTEITTADSMTESGPKSELQKGVRPQFDSSTAEKTRFGSEPASEDLSEDASKAKPTKPKHPK